MPLAATGQMTLTQTKRDVEGESTSHYCRSNCCHLPVETHPKFMRVLSGLKVSEREGGSEYLKEQDRGGGGPGPSVSGGAGGLKEPETFKAGPVGNGETIAPHHGRCRAKKGQYCDRVKNLRSKHCDLKTRTIEPVFSMHARGPVPQNRHSVLKNTCLSRPLGTSFDQ